MRLLGKVLSVMIYLLCYLSQLSQSSSYNRSSTYSHLNSGFDNFTTPSTEDVRQHHTTVSSVPRKNTSQRTMDYEISVSTTDSVPIIVFSKAVPNRNFRSFKYSIFLAPRKLCPQGELLDKSGNCTTPL